MLFYTPRRILAILARVKKTNFISVRVFQICLAPQSAFVFRLFDKFQTEIFQTLNFSVQIFAFKV